MIVLGIDPGPLKSGIIRWDGKKQWGAEIIDNMDLFAYLMDAPEDLIVVEIMSSSYSHVAGKDIMQTQLWAGKFLGAFDKYKIEVFRSQVSKYFCNITGANDAQLKSGIVDIVDPMREFGKLGKGTKKNPGPLYGISESHIWDALAYAMYGYEF